MARGWTRLAGVAVVLVAVVLPSDGMVATAQSAAVPAVSIQGPDTVLHGLPPCSDGVYAGVADLLILRSEAAPPVIEVGLTVSGDAVAGQDYEPLPKSVTLGDAATATVQLRILGGPAFDGTLVVTLEPGANYTLGEPSSLTIRLIRFDGRCEPPTFTDATTNQAQSIGTGETLAALEAVPFEDHGMFFELESGSLPPGISLQFDGTLSGAARAAGTYVAVIAACTPVFGRLCSTTELTVTVTGPPLEAEPPPCSARQLVAESDAVFPSSMGLSADGRRAIVHQAGAFGGLLLLDTVSGSVSPIPMIDDFQFFVRSDISRISADGRTVVYSARRRSSVAPGLFAYDVVTGETTRFAVPEAVVRGIELSADGQTIAFAQDSFLAEQVFRLDRDTGAVQQLTAFTDNAADGHLRDISVDGRIVLLSQDGPNATPGTLFVSRDGGPLEPAGPVTDGVSLKLRRDGQSLLEIIGGVLDEGPTIISIRSLDDGSVTEQTTIPGRTAFGASHSSTQLAFSSNSDLTGHNSDASGEAFSVDLITGEIVQLTDIFGGSTRLVVGGMTSDGNTVLVSSTVDLTTGAPLPRAGGPAVYLLDCAAQPPLRRTG